MNGELRSKIPLPVASNNSDDDSDDNKSEDEENESAFVFILNFASAKNPGGGFLKGSSAQEESIARSSCLFPAVHTSRMYSVNRSDNRKLLYANAAIYTPRCVIFRDDDGNLLSEPYFVGVATIPAPNAGCLKRGVSQDELDRTMFARICATLAIAAQRKHRYLVLGAFGCGVFRNDVRRVARLFYKALHEAFLGVFEKVSFSITPDNCNKFRAAFAPTEV